MKSLLEVLAEGGPILTMYSLQMVTIVKECCPGVPVVLYINGNAGFLERMQETGADVIGLDWTIDMADGRQRLDEKVGVQGNVDPALLFAPLQAISEEIERYLLLLIPLSFSGYY